MANDVNQVEPTPQIEGNPGPNISGDQGGQGLSQASGQSVDLSAFKDELLDAVKREVQSVKDTRLGKHETRLDDIEGTLSRYESLLAGGMSKEQAQDRMRLDKKLSDLEQAVTGQAPSQPSAGTGEKLVTERQASILEKAGIDLSDRRLRDFWNENVFPNNDAYIKALDEAAVGWQQADARKPQPSTGTVAPTAPSVPTGDGTYTKEKYQTDMLAARGKPNELARIKAAARADGVDVDNIGFI